MISLRDAYAAYTVALNLSLFVVFVIVHLSGASNGVTLAFALAYAIHAAAVWIFFVIVLFRSERNPFIVKHVTLWRLAFLFLITIFEYGALYAATLNYDLTVMTGVPPGSGRGLILRRGLFLATETMGGLGSGAIFATEDSELPFVLIGLNTTQSLVLSYFVVAQVLRMFSLQNDTESIMGRIRRDPITFLIRRANFSLDDIERRVREYRASKSRSVRSKR